jgi:hypothetical protein
MQDMFKNSALGKAGKLPTWKKEEFRAWLVNAGYRVGPINSLIANCSTIDIVFQSMEIYTMVLQALELH